MFVYESTARTPVWAWSLSVVLRRPTGWTEAGIMRRLSVLLLVVSGLSQWAGARDVVVTGVAGRSWLNQLNRNFQETSMGKTGHLGPAPALSEGESARWQMGLSTSA